MESDIFCKIESCGISNASEIIGNAGDVIDEATGLLYDRVHRYYRSFGRGNAHLMNVKRLTTNVTVQRLRLLQLRGLPGSLGPFHSSSLVLAFTECW